jgi:transcriptional regulator with XRE-family HTH domain
MSKRIKSEKSTSHEAKSDENSIGDFLKEGRKKKGMSLMDVAKAIGLSSPQSVWDWESGKGSGIPADMLLRLVKLYGLSASDAYDQLMKFHQERTRLKVELKFREAKVKIFGRDK